MKKNMEIKEYIKKVKSFKNKEFQLVCMYDEEYHELYYSFKGKLNNGMFIVFPSIPPILPKIYTPDTIINDVDFLTDKELKDFFNEESKRLKKQLDKRNQEKYGN